MTTTAMDLATLVSSAKGGVVTLEPAGKEFQGPLVIRRPVTINGQGGTIWAEKGPVLIIESTGVVLNELNVEVTGTEDRLVGEEACAIVARTSPPTLNRVAVRGHVAGITGEEGEWRYPRIVRLNKVKANTAHTFALRLVVPVACRIDSMISGVTVGPTDLPAGEVEVALRVESMSEGIRLKGLLRLTTARLTRRIELSGHIAADGVGVTTGTGQALYQPADWSGGAAPAPKLPPQSATVPPPVPRPAPPPIPPSHSPPPVVPTPAAKAPLPPPVPAPLPVPPPVVADPPKNKSRYRFPTSAGGAFSPPPPPPPAESEELEVGEPIAEELPPTPEPTPDTNVGSDPLKKTGRRQIKKMPGLFGDPPPTS